MNDINKDIREQITPKGDGNYLKSKGFKVYESQY